MMPITLFWIIVMIICIVIELNTLTLTTIWFALGAIAAAFVSVAMPDNLVVQAAAFVIVSGAAVMLTRPFARKIAGKSVRTNADRVVGEEAVVMEKIDNAANVGQVKVMGQAWRAKAKDNESIYDVGDVVIVEEIQGVKLIVRSK